MARFLGFDILEAPHPNVLLPELLGICHPYRLRSTGYAVCIVACCVHPNVHVWSMVKFQ